MDEAPTRLIDLLALDELPDGTMRMAWVDGTQPVLVVNAGGAIRAVQGICTHEYVELDRGFLTGGADGATVTCALHLSRFDLASGEPLDPPADLALATYRVVVADGRILIDVPEGPLAVNE